MVHPIFAERERLRLYLLAWAPVGALLALLLAVGGRLGWLESATLAFPLAFVYAFVTLSAWYVSRSTPATAAGLLRIVGAQAIRELWIGEIATQIRIELSDLSADGNVVTYTAKVYHGDRLVDTIQGLDVVADGKIIFDGTADKYRSECESDPSQAFCPGN